MEPQRRADAVAIAIDVDAAARDAGGDMHVDPLVVFQDAGHRGLELALELLVVDGGGVADRHQLGARARHRTRAGHEVQIARAGGARGADQLIEPRAAARRLVVRGALDQHLVVRRRRGLRGRLRCRRRIDLHGPAIRARRDRDGVARAVRRDLEARGPARVDGGERVGRRDLAHERDQLIVRRHLRRVAIAAREPQGHALVRRQDEPSRAELLEAPQIRVDLRHRHPISRTRRTCDLPMT